jgi:hypothetical protein
MGQLSRPRAFGHNGSNCCIAWADPKGRLVFAYLTDLLTAGHEGPPPPGRGQRRPSSAACTRTGSSLPRTRWWAPGKGYSTYKGTATLNGDREPSGLRTARTGAD